MYNYMILKFDEITKKWKQVDIFRTYYDCTSALKEYYQCNGTGIFRIVEVLENITCLDDLN